MGTHPIFESDFDCLTEWRLLSSLFAEINQFCRLNMGLNQVPSPQRDPYPYPKLEGDEQFHAPQPGRQNDYRKTDVGTRLFDTPTLSSARREIYHFNRDAPIDCLDFELKSVYDHHNDFLKNQPYVLRQKVTSGNPDGVILKNRVQNVVDEEDHKINDHENKLLRIVTGSKDTKNSPHPGAIHSHHNATTNRGYSRKHNGGFYSI